MDKKLNIAVAGATGFTGGELCRLLLSHKNLGKLIPASRDEVNLSSVHPNLMGCSLKTTRHEKLLTCPTMADIVFFCTPTGQAMREASVFLDAGVRVVDLSADFRFKSPEDFKVAHGKSHLAASILNEAVYGLTELNRSAIKNAKLVANPGCYVTAFLLAVAPLFRNPLQRIIDKESVIYVSAINGTTGTSKSQNNVHHASVANNILPYSLEGHRHTFEMEDQISQLFDQKMTVDFNTAHAPLPRGIFMQISLKIKEDIDGVGRDQLLTHFTDFYGNGSHGEHFVQVISGKKDKNLLKDYSVYPSMARVCGSNLCHIGLDFNEHNRHIKIISVIDNLVKGAAGSAIQNMNLMFKLNETSGLTHYGT